MTEIHSHKTLAMLAKFYYIIREVHRIMMNQRPFYQLNVACYCCFSLNNIKFIYQLLFNMDKPTGKRKREVKGRESSVKSKLFVVK